MWHSTFSGNGSTTYATTLSPHVKFLIYFICETDYRVWHDILVARVLTLHMLGSDFGTGFNPSSPVSHLA